MTVPQAAQCTLLWKGLRNNRKPKVFYLGSNLKLNTSPTGCVETSLNHENLHLKKTLKPLPDCVDKVALDRAGFNIVADYCSLIWQFIRYIFLKQVQN